MEALTATEERILRAAVELFNKHGVRRTRISDVAQEAGVGASTVYAHYGSKTNLVRRALLEVTQDGGAESASAVVDSLERMVLGQHQNGDPEGENDSQSEPSRERILASAREVFEQVGYVDSTVANITANAGLSHGTFYTYFSSKEEVFRELIVRLVANAYTEAYESGRASDHSRAGGYDSHYRAIENANRGYIRYYRQNAGLFAVWEQVVVFNPEFRELRRDFRWMFVERACAALTRLQEMGHADKKLDPLYASHSLGAMVEQFAFVWWVLREPFDEERAIETLTRLWANAIGLRESSGAEE